MAIVNEKVNVGIRLPYNSANKKRFLPNINSKGIKNLYYEIPMCMGAKFWYPYVSYTRILS